MLKITFSPMFYAKKLNSFFITTYFVPNNILQDARLSDELYMAIRVPS